MIRRTTSRLLSPPGPTEGHDEFLSRCEADGGSAKECELLWQDAQGIAAPKGISLRADLTEMRQAERKSFVRAITAMMLATRDNARPESVLARAFPGDMGAQRVLKAATSPSTTSGFPAATAQKILPQLAPQSASSRLLELASSVDLRGWTTVKVPYIGQSGRPPVPFIAEGGVMPVIDLITSMVSVGPCKKLAVGAALTREVQVASGNNAERIVGDAISISAAQSLDALLFSNAAATTAAPAGLLNGLAPITSSAVAGAQGIANDLALLAAAIASAGINVDDMIIVTTPSLATKLRILSSIKFNNTVMSSSSVPAGEVIAIVPQGIVSAFDGNVSIEISVEPTVHFEDTTPLDISTVGTPNVVAAPTRSLFQTDSLAVKIRCWCSWAVHPGAISYMTGAAW